MIIERIDGQYVATWRGVQAYGDSFSDAINGLLTVVGLFG